MRLCSGVDSIDAVLNGGILPGGITEISGAAGTGKSALVLQFAASHQLLNGRFSGKPVLLVATDARFRTERLAQVYGSRSNEEGQIELAMRHFKVFQIGDAGALEIFATNILNQVMSPGTLLIIDSIAGPLRLSDDDAQRHRNPIYEIASYIVRALHNHKSWCICINQVADVSSNSSGIVGLNPKINPFEDGTYPASPKLDHFLNPFLEESPDLINAPQPALGLSWFSCISTRIYLHKKHSSKILLVPYSKYISKAASCEYQIDHSGLI